MPGLSNRSTAAPAATGTAPARAQVIGFVAPQARTGRTGVLATTAAVLTSNGKRVLLLDCCRREPITLHNYLWPFHLEPPADVDSQGRPIDERPAVTLEQIEAGATPEQYALPMGLGDLALYWIDPDTLGRSDAAARRLAETLAGLPYDYILIDYPSEAGEHSPGHVTVLCDVAVLCYTPQQVSQAGAILARLQERRNGTEVRVVAVPVLPEPSVDARWRSVPTLCEARAGNPPDWPVTADPDANSAEPPDATVTVTIKGYQIPGVDQVLPLFIEERRDLDAYAHLAGVLTDGAVADFPEISALVRSRYRREYGFATDNNADVVTMIVEDHDRGYADWLTALLHRGGMEVETFVPGRAPTGGTICVISSPDLQDSAAMQTVLHDLIASSMAGAADLVWIKARDGGPPPVGRPRMTIDLTGPPTWDPESVIRARFGLVRLTGSPPNAPRLPAAALVQKMNLPARNPAFVGREDIIKELRDQLLSDGPHEVVFGGGPGIGKSEIVREFAYRFAYDYDVVWWIPAQSAHSVLGALTALASEMPIKNRANPPRAAVEALEGQGAERSLLIYDNADDPALLENLIPRGSACHVLITSRHPDAQARPKPIEAFSSAESVAMLVKRVPNLPDDTATAIADAARQHPLALRMLSAWLREYIPILQRRKNYSETSAIAELSRELIKRLGHPDGLFPESLLTTPEMTTIARSLAIVLDTMKAVDLHLTVRLAELAAFLSPDGASLDLLRSSPILRLLADEQHATPTDHQDYVPEASPIVGNEDYIDVVLWSGTRYGLFEVDWGQRGQLRIHRAVQDLLKGLMNGERARRQSQIQGALAEYAPSDPQVEEPAYEARLTELQKHFEYCNPTVSDQEPVRHWVNKQIRHLYRRRDRDTWKAALDIATTAEAAWRTAGIGERDAQLTRLQVQMANLHRALGNNVAARRIDEELLAREPNAEIMPTLSALRVRRGLAGDFRGEGLFTEALEHDRQVYYGLLALLGRDHRDTLMTQHNLAISNFLAGYPRRALQTEEEVYQARLRLIGPGEVLAWRSLCDMGGYQRELGWLAQSLDTLIEARTGIRRVPGLDNRNHVEMLRIRRAIEVTKRCLKQPTFSADELEEVTENYTEVLGPDHPDTLACRLSLAAAFRVQGKVDAAVNTAAGCLAAYERTLSEGHPFRAAALVNLAMYRREKGDADAAWRDAWRGHDSLFRRLREDHQWTIAAAIDLAACQYSAGQVDEARSLLTKVADSARARLTESHPYTYAARRNLELLGQGASPDVWETLDIDVPQT